MNRRDMLKLGTAGGFATLATAGCTRTEESAPSMQTNPQLTWRLVSSFPRATDNLFGPSEVLANRVSELTGGRFRIRAYPAGEIVPGLQVFDAVQQGSAEIGHSTSSYYTGKNPAFVFDAAVPFGLDAEQHATWLTRGGGLELLRRLFSDFNIYNLPGGNTTWQSGGWFRRQINSLSDLRGLRMRIPGLGGEVMDRLGVSVQLIAGGEVYQALERGLIDATEFSGPYDDEKLGFHKITKLYYTEGWWEPGAGCSFYVNKSAWDRLPPLYQQVLTVASIEADRHMITSYNFENPQALDRLRREGVQEKKFPDEVLTAAHRETVDILEERAAEDTTYRSIYESWKAFRSSSNAWRESSEGHYERFTF